MSSCSEAMCARSRSRSTFRRARHSSEPGRPWRSLLEQACRRSSCSTKRSSARDPDVGRRGTFQSAVDDRFLGERVGHPRATQLLQPGSGTDGRRFRRAARPAPPAWPRGRGEGGRGCRRKRPWASACAFGKSLVLVGFAARFLAAGLHVAAEAFHGAAGAEKERRADDRCDELFMMSPWYRLAPRGEMGFQRNHGRAWPRAGGIRRRRQAVSAAAPGGVGGVLRTMQQPLDEENRAERGAERGREGEAPSPMAPAPRRPRRRTPRIPRARPRSRASAAPSAVGAVEREREGRHDRAGDRHRQQHAAHHRAEKRRAPEDQRRRARTPRPAAGAVPRGGIAGRGASPRCRRQPAPGGAEACRRERQRQPRRAAAATTPRRRPAANAAQPDASAIAPAAAPADVARAPSGARPAPRPRRA